MSFTHTLFHSDIFAIAVKSPELSTTELQKTLHCLVSSWILSRLFNHSFQSGKPDSSFGTGKYNRLFHGFLSSADTTLSDSVVVFAKLTIVGSPFIIVPSGSFEVLLALSFPPIAATLSSSCASRAHKSIP